MTSRRLFLATLFTGLAAGAGVTVAQPYGPPGGPLGGPPPYRPIPELRPEVVLPPRHGMIWEPGHWQWTGRDYVWSRGRYIPVRPRYRQFVPGRWVRRGPGWVWIGPHWE